MPPDLFHPLNWRIGWGLILIGFLVGAVLGIFFHDENFLGGYSSFRRRILRLGHIACIALGLLNVVFSATVALKGMSLASTLFIVGAIAMPTVCFLTAWKKVSRHLFFIPVLSLVGAVVIILIGGFP